MVEVSGGATATPTTTDTSHAASPTDDHSSDHGVCIPPTHDFGKEWEVNASKALLWVTFACSLMVLCYYAYHTYLATCGWEEVYVASIELACYLLEIFKGHDPPFIIYQTNGEFTLWLRYAGWLLTCPVLLIHLSNITGLHEEYSHRTMTLLVSDIGTIVFGATCAFTHGPIKVVFFCIGLCYGANTFYNAAQVYIESYHLVPVGRCKHLVMGMAWCFFTAWAMFPLLFIAGPEGFGIISVSGSIIGHSFADILSKNLWGLLGHTLRVEIHEHIIKHGDIRKKVHVNVMGHDEVIEEMMDHEDNETEKHSTAVLASRNSFINMRDRMAAQGVECRASLDGSAMHNMENGTIMNQWGGPVKQGPRPTIENGCVVVGLSDPQMGGFWQEQFNTMPANMQVQICVGPNEVAAAVEQNFHLTRNAAMNNQFTSVRPVDFVLLSPEYLRDQSPNGLVATLKSRYQQRVVAFGWTVTGADRAVIEAAPIDGWLEGPSFATGFDHGKLQQCVSAMQQKRHAATVIGANPMFGGMTNGNNAGNGTWGNPNGGFNGATTQGFNAVATTNTWQNHAAQAPNNNGSWGTATGNGGGWGNGNGNGNGSVSGTTTPRAMNRVPSYSNNNGTMMGQNSGFYGGNAQTQPTGESEMLQQLMGEITRLKGELSGMDTPR